MMGLMSAQSRTHAWMGMMTRGMYASRNGCDGMHKCCVSWRVVACRSLPLSYNIYKNMCVRVRMYTSCPEASWLDPHQCCAVSVLCVHVMSCMSYHSDMMWMFSCSCPHLLLLSLFLFMHYASCSTHVSCLICHMSCVVCCSVLPPMLR